MMARRILVAVTAGHFLLAAGPAWAGGVSERSVENMTPGSEASVLARTVPNARMKAVSSAGKATGVAWGYYREMKHLELALLSEKGVLDQVYAFQPCLIEGRVLPPVVESAKRAARFNSTRKATFARRVYRIIHAARIVAAPPDWRQWLLPANPKPRPTQAVLLPRNSQERAVWRQAVRHGWAIGRQQAMAVETENVHRLTRTLAGMIMFMRLRAQGMVSGPVVVAGSPVIKVNGRRLSLGIRIFQIDQPAGFAPSRLWHPGFARRSRDDQ